MVKLQFTKLQATGNDFILLDLRSGDVNTSHDSVAPISQIAALALSMCDRHFGIGADGLLVLCDSERADVRMRMFNPDGTEDMCGNGTRCVARYMMEMEAKARARYRIETLAGLKEVTGEISGGDSRFSINMGEPAYEPRALPALIDRMPILDYPLQVSGETFHITSLSTGTPHTCIFLEGPVDEATFQKVSPQIERHACFPERTSVLWIHLKSENVLAVRIWERAVGETLSCGTGACAAAVAAHLKGLVGRRTEVVSRGGVLEIEWLEDGSLVKTGPAETVFRGEWRGNEGRIAYEFTA